MEREQREQDIKNSVVRMASLPATPGRGSSEKVMTEASKALAEQRRKAKEYREQQKEIYKHTVSQI